MEAESRPADLHGRYEDLIEHTDEVGEQLRGFVGLPPNAEERARPAQEQVITSASMWQARQPFYRSSIGRWRAYAPHVPELERLFPDARPAGQPAAR